MGNSALNYEEGEDVLELCAQIAKKFNISNETRNGFNVIQQDISKVGALDIGFYNKIFSKNFSYNIKQHIDTYKPVLFLLNLDEINAEILDNAFTVYIGHHGDTLAQISDIVLPSPAYTEKSSTYVNMEGRVLQTTRCYHPLGQAKEEWKIFRSLSNNLYEKLKFNNLSELRTEFCHKYPLFKQLNILPNQKNINFSSKKKIKKRILDYNIKNFYMNDVISRASITMAKCTNEILNK